MVLLLQVEQEELARPGRSLRLRDEALEEGGAGHQSFEDVGNSGACAVREMVLS